jgi:Tfp pilus assembly protein PilF
MPGKVFVNYRRDDERAMAARIRDRLAATFGNANVFMDVDHLMAGQRFDKALEKALAQTDVFLCVIGPRWLELLSERQGSGERDYVREEIAGALQRGIVVIPVLIERTPLPRADALPEDIRDLVLHQKHVVTHEQFGRDVAGLVEAIRFGRKEAQGEAESGGTAVRWAAAVGLAALVLGGLVLAFEPWVSRHDRPAKNAGQADEIGTYFNRGRDYLHKGDYDRAIADFTRVIEIDPRKADAYHYRGIAYDRKGDRDRAIADITKPIEIDPRNASAYNDRGILYHMKGEHDRAIADFTRVIEIDPRNAGAYNNRGRDYWHKGDYNRALADFDKAIEIDPRQPHAHINRGVTYEALGGAAEAIAAYRQALAINPNDQASSDALKRLGASP